MFSPQDISADRISKVSREPFFIFEVDNFFRPETFKELDRQFPKKLDFAEKRTHGDKYPMGSNTEEYIEFTKKVPIWAQLYDHFSDTAVVARFFELANSVPSERVARQKKPWRLAHSPRPRGVPIAQLLRLQGSLAGYTPTRLNFEFSYLELGCYIPPHTDAARKLLSLMIYFPDDGIEYPVGTGTEFYRGINATASRSSWRTNPLNDADEERKFFEDHEVFYTSEFTPNKLVGFVKTSNSWHGVRPLSLPNNATRRSLNINYLLI